MTSLKVGVGVLLLLLLSLPSLAVSEETSDLHNINNWNGAINCIGGWGGCWGGYSGGHVPNFNGSTFRWGYGGGVINQTIAINQALQDSGIQVDGYRYHWHVKNLDAGYPQNRTQDTFKVTVDVYKANGDLYKTYEYDYSYAMDWTHFAGTEYFPDKGLAPSFFGNINLSAYGRDNGYWAGYYGPEFQPLDFHLIYSHNPCISDPLHDPSCSGYAEAYAQQLYDQNCDANPLYDSGCPGYTTAYYNQQCAINALYDTGCPNYAQAYYDQQCSIDALYDSGCPGYAQAYYNQQCGLDPLYDRGCDGYGEAYAQKYILIEDTTTTDSTQTISTTSETAVPITDPEEIAIPSTTGDATVDSVLKDLTDVPITTVVMEDTTVATVTVDPETQETKTETETSTEADSAGEMEELVAEVGDVSESSGDVEESDSEGSEDNGDSESSESNSDSKGKDEGKKDSKREKMKKAIAKKATQLAESMSQAASLEAQQAAQATVLALINYVPDFNTYQRQMNGGYLPDAVGYADTQVPESRRGLRNGLAQQLLHEKMVEMQYENISSQ